MANENLTPSTLRKAADLKEKIEVLEQQLEAVLSGGEISAPVEIAAEPQPVKRKRGRPAKTEKPAETEPPVKTDKKGRRKITAAGRAAMAAAAKARWAKARAAKAA